MPLLMFAATAFNAARQRAVALRRGTIVSTFDESLMRFPLTFARSCAIGALLLLAACGSPEQREAEHIKDGKELYESGQFSKAAIEFRNALQINPAGVEAKYYIGLIFEKKNNIPAAISAFQEVSLQDPNRRDVQ